MLIIPKIGVIKWASGYWNDYTFWESLFILREDLLLCGIIYFVLLTRQLFIPKAAMQHKQFLGV